jgi:AcrR family transcriptional regulator
MPPTPLRRRAERHRQADPGTSTPAARRGPSGGTKKPITVDAIISTAFGIVEREGYEALTMRRVATALETGPSSLYAHVVNKGDLDELLIGRLCAGIDLPAADPATWRQQAISVCAQLRDQYLRYPGISRAAFAVAPSNLDIMRVSEGMLAILLAGGVAPQTAAWAIDSLFLYVNAYSLEVSLVDDHDENTWVVSRAELMRRFAALPDTYPQSKRYAAELTAGTGHDRFDFTIGLMIDGLAALRKGPLPDLGRQGLIGGEELGPPCLDIAALPPAMRAARMASIVAWGWDTIETCEPATSVIVEPARSAMLRWVAGGMTRSSVPITAQLGMVFQAVASVPAVFAPRVTGRWLAAISRRSASGRSCANDSCTVAGLRNASASPSGAPG